MTDPVLKRAHRLTRRAWWHLVWERFAPVLAPGFAAVLLFVIAASAGLWQRIGDPFRLMGLLLALAALGYSLYKAARLSWPTRSEARRRVERDNDFAHRPLDVIYDHPAMGPTGDPAWEHHVERAKTLAGKARPSRLRPTLARMDKYYLRFGLPLALGLAVMVGFGDNYERLRAGLLPGWQHGMSAEAARYEAWIDPPAYTHRPPGYFKGKSKMEVPEGSQFVARIMGLKTAPRLIVRQNGRVLRITPKRLGPKSFEARFHVADSATASFRIGKAAKSWALSVVKDKTPTIQFDEAPKAGKNDRLEFSYSLSDDYGVGQVFLSMKRTDVDEQSGTEHNTEDLTDEVSVPLPGRAVRKLEKEPAALDLTRHKWAGKKVRARLLAVDGKKQVGSTPWVEMIVPEKIFVEPLAKAVAEQRQILLNSKQAYKPLHALKPMSIADLDNRPLFAIDHPERSILRAPEGVRRVADLIDAITDVPSTSIFNDPAVYMGLRNVYRRLLLAKSQQELAGTPEDLWAIAIRAEFGRLGDALEDMKRAERALNNAMARRAPQREIDALFDRYNKAVDRYIEQLTLEAARRAKNNKGDGEGGGGSDFQVDQIQELLDAIEEANRRGDTVAARKALAKLAQLLEHMQIELAQGQGGSGKAPGDGMSDELRKALEDLNDVLGQQRELRDDTLDAARKDADQWDDGGQDQNQDQNQGKGQDQDQARQDDTPGGEQLAERQKQIADMLRRLKDVKPGGGRKDGKTGSGRADQDKNAKNGAGGLDNKDVAEALDAAEEAMKRATEALQNGEFYGAEQAQTDAVQALRKAGEGLLREEAKRLAREDKNGKGQKAGEAADPFGRDGGTGVGDENIDLDSKSDEQRARELLQELRRRAGEREREKQERDYLERLLRRF